MKRNIYPVKSMVVGNAQAKQPESIKYPVSKVPVPVHTEDDFAVKLDTISCFSAVSLS